MAIASGISLATVLRTLLKEGGRGERLKYYKVLRGRDDCGSSAGLLE
jgi:hypothetical protein